MSLGNEQKQHKSFLKLFINLLKVLRPKTLVGNLQLTLLEHSDTGMHLLELRVIYIKTIHYDICTIH